MQLTTLNSPDAIDVRNFSRFGISPLWAAAVSERGARRFAGCNERLGVGGNFVNAAVPAHVFTARLIIRPDSFVRSDIVTPDLFWRPQIK